MADKILNKLLAATAQAEWPDKMITNPRHSNRLQRKVLGNGEDRLYRRVEDLPES